MKELRVGFSAEKYNLETLAGEWNKQYSVAYYARLQSDLGASADLLQSVIESNNLRWAAEHVFGVNYQEYFLKIENGVLLSPDFGNISLVSMCHDAVLIREKAGVDLARAENEKLGIVRLEKLLVKMRPGQTAILISPPDPNDKSMGGYNMLYVYEKQDEHNVRSTAIRDNSSLLDLRVLAGSLSGVMPIWQEVEHLEFVSTPFVTNLLFDELVQVVGIEQKDMLPDWLNDLSRTIAQAMLHELNAGELGEVKRIFDAFQMTVKTRYEQEKGGIKEKLWIEPMEAISDDGLWIQAQRSFLAMGGMEMIKAGGSCGAGDIGLKQDGWKDNNTLSSLMGIDESTTSETTSKMECVECPFCHKTVDAILTSSKIKCPECKAEVSRS